MENLKLVIPSLEYKNEVMAFLDEVNLIDKGYPWQYAGMSKLKNCNSYEEWIKDKENEKNGINLPNGYVPASTYLLVRTNDNKVIGICNIRHTLSVFLLNYGGHIGYTIRPSERRKGYGIIQLEKALEKCNDLNIDKVLITCNEENIASAKTIEKCYGEYENTVHMRDETLRRYWITLSKINNIHR